VGQPSLVLANLVLLLLSFLLLLRISFRGNMGREYFLFLLRLLFLLFPLLLSLLLLVVLFLLLLLLLLLLACRYLQQSLHFAQVPICPCLRLDDTGQGIGPVWIPRPCLQSLFIEGAGWTAAVVVLRFLDVGQVGTRRG
jgi:putative flippase GtrA